MRKSLTALTAATTIAVTAVAMPTTANAGGVRRSAASSRAQLSAAHLHGPIMRIRITDMVTGMGLITVTAIPRTTATMHRSRITDTTRGATLTEFQGCETGVGGFHPALPPLVGSCCIRGSGSLLPNSYPIDIVGRSFWPLSVEFR